MGTWTGRNGRLHRWYLLASIVLIAGYPLLSDAGRDIDHLLVSIGTIPAVIVGLRGISAHDRSPWWLLLAALTIVNVANVVRLFPGDLAVAGSSLLEAVGDALALAAALALVARHGRDDLGSIIDTTIVALALGALVWDAVLLPHLVGAYQTDVARVSLFVVVFALCGGLGAVARLIQIVVTPVPALWLLIAAVALALAGDIVLAVASDPWLDVAATMMFLAVYTAIGLFGLASSAAMLARRGPVLHEDALSLGRLLFLGAAVAVIPVTVGVRALLGEDVDGLLLTVGGATIAALVMVRIGRLSSARDRAERALRYEAAHDSLTGLPNRREFVARLNEDLGRIPGCVILFCDLDGFKAVNDRLGHGAGDQLLVEVARRLRTCVRERDVVSRFGGDEFLILFRDAPLAEVETICNRISAVLSRPIELRGEQVMIGASIGIAVASAEADPEELIRRADHAMYEAKADEPAAPGIRIVTT